jgi:hypothetical protein
MEHLYRMALSVSRIYLDRSQSGVYLEAHTSSSDWLATTWTLKVAFVHSVTMSTQRGCRNCPSSRTS